MATTWTANQIELKNIFYLTDFSEPSERALSFAMSIARNDGATIHALHILTPAIPSSCHEAVKADDGLAEIEMQKVETKLCGVDLRYASPAGNGSLACD